MAKTNLNAFIAKDTRFVAHWLKAKACKSFVLYLKVFKNHLYYLWHVSVRVLSIKPCLHTQLPEHNRSYWKVSRGWGYLITWNGPMMGHLNSFSASGGGNLNKNFQKILMPGGCPGGMLKLRFDWYIIGLYSTKAAPQKSSFDSHDECRHRSRNDNLLSTRNEKCVCHCIYWDDICRILSRELCPTTLRPAAIKQLVHALACTIEFYYSNFIHCTNSDFPIGWFCTTWHWVMTKQLPWRHYRGVIPVV